MNYLFRGSLCGELCDDCREPLVGLELRLYQAAGEMLTAAAVAPEKDTFRAIAEGELAGRTLIASGEIGPGGRYSIEIDTAGYIGGPIDVDLYCRTMPRPKIGPHAEAKQFAITTLQPRWKQTEAGQVAGWDYCIPNRFWCYILSLFGVWSICGRLTTCDAGTPIAGAKVSAFDVDWLQDDPLGSAATDGAGHFLISYLTDDFKRTPFSPIVNVELVGGPDVYFRAELGGQPILSEPSSAGRAAGRQNVGPCLCVELCTDKVIGDPPTVPHWQRLEAFDTHPAPGQPGSQFSAEGYAGDPSTGAFVFGGSVLLQGNCPLTSLGTGNALQYRFLIGEYDWSTTPDDPTTMPNIAPGTMSPVTAIAATTVGYLFYTDGNSTPQSAPVVVGPADVGVDGWIQVDGKAVTVPMYNPPNSTTVIPVSKSNFLPTFDLFRINTPAITSAHPAKLPGGLPKVDAGRSLTTPEREPIRRYRLAFEVRDAGTLGIVAADDLSAVIFDNSPVIAALDLEELRLNACNPLANQPNVHLLYTVDHPHLRSFSISIGNNTGTVHSPPQTPEGHFTAGGFFFRGGSGGPHNGSNTGGVAVSIAGDQPCAYAVNLGWLTRRWGDLGQSSQILYCK